MEKKNTSRREFLATAGKAGVAAGLSFTALPSLANEFGSNSNAIEFKQAPLPYAYKELEPIVDAMTMEIHYSKHAAAYAKALNEAVTAEIKGEDKPMSLEAILSIISKFSTKMRNNAGGHYNHELFWQCMTNKPMFKPMGKLAAAIDKDFGSFENFKTQFADAAKTRFGSGWAWLIITADKKLKITSTPNQDNPLMDITETKGIPLLGLDVWEHAYYLKYQNKRPDYITNWWGVVNWDFVQKRFEALA
jgi:Fe-Mn family superoxide dismutase